MPDTIRQIKVLGTRLACANYVSAVAAIMRLAKRNQPTAVCASNTHIVSLSRHDVEFGRIMAKFDLVLPDGMPLIWSLNAKGAGLHDRVYGPYFMRYALAGLGPPWRHYFFGSSREILNKLVLAAREINPDIQIAGTCSPPFRCWTEEEEQGFADEINASNADFVWVALGGVRQERWIVRNQHRFKRGVFLAVGDAFALIAGNRPFAPMVMQKMGLTWLYRLYQEPLRLLPRYLKYNSLFVYYTMRDFLFGTPALANRAPIGEGKRIAFIGSRGVPATYSGFETVVEQLGQRLASSGWKVTVYNRPAYHRVRLKRFRGMHLIHLPTVYTKSLETIVHTLICFEHALFRRYDIVYLCGVGNAIFCLTKFPKRWKIVINVDGTDFKRKKWRGFARMWLQGSEWLASRLADRVIADNPEIVKHYQDAYAFRPTYIAYGAPTELEPVQDGQLQKLGLRPREYILFVSRLTPENEPELLLRAYRRSGLRVPLVLLGSAGYETTYFRTLEALKTETVLLPGAIHGRGYVELSQNCLFFVLPSAVEATRLVLLDQMGFGNAILFQESAASREVVGDAGEAFSSEGAEEALAASLVRLAERPEICRELGERANARARQRFSWAKVAAEYEALFNEMQAESAASERTVSAGSAPGGN